MPSDRAIAPKPHRTPRRGITAVSAIVMMTVLVGFVSFAIDLGRVQLAKTQLQQAADAAARAAAANLPNGITATQNAAVLWGGYNSADGTPVVIDPTTDVDFGTWSKAGRTFSVLSGAARSTANAVRVYARRTAARGTSIPLAFGGIIGQSNCDANSTSIAYYGPSPTWSFVGLNGVTLQTGTITTDSYDSSAGAYIAATAAKGGYIVSNGNVALNGGTVTVNSDLYMKPAASLTTTGAVTYGTRHDLASSVVWPTPSAGSYATTNSNWQLGLPATGAVAYYSAGSYTAPPGTYYFDSINITGGSITMTAPSVIYMNGPFDISGGSFNISSNRAGDIIIYQTTSSHVAISGVTAFMADIQAPASAVTVSAPTVYGRLVGSTLTINGSSALHGDASLPNGAGATNPATILPPAISIVK